MIVVVVSEGKAGVRRSMVIESTAEESESAGARSSPELGPATGTKIPPRGRPPGVILLF